MRSGIPESHIQEAMKLEARALVELFQIDLKRPNGTILSLFLCPQKEVVWQGKTWAADTPCSVSETGLNVSGEVTRPKFSIVNPNGIWSRYVHQRYTENANVSRYRILRPDVDSDTNSFQFSTWRISKTISLSKDIVVCELRTVLDGHQFKIPADTYRPPTYPAVSVQ